MDMEGLSSICASLGILEEDETTKQMIYTKGEHCLDALKDLLRFLRRDDPETREVFKQVCRWNIVSKDLIPIIEHCQHDRNLVLNAVKVLVFLSMPIEPSSSDIPQQIEYLWNMKFSLTSSDAVAVIVSLLEGPLENLECELFTEDDWKLVQLVLTFFRNILSIQDISSLQKAGQFLSLRDRFLELLFRENVMDLIIVITQQIGGSRGYLRQDNLLLLDIFHYIFMGQDPELLAKAHLKRSEEGGDAKACIDDLKSIMEEEAKKRRVSRLQHTNRHSQFSGTFTRFTVGGSTVVVKGNPNYASQNTLLKSHGGHGISTGHGDLPLMRKNILALLHDFVNQFLSGGYNVFMKSVREDIEKEHHTVQKGDIIVFFKVAEFVTSFQYHKCLASKPSDGTAASEASADNCADDSFFQGDVCGPIAASMNESMFQLVISSWRNAFEGLKETNDYKFLSAASSLLKNMIRMCNLVLKLFPEDSKEPLTARILLYKLFYDQTDQGMTQFILNQIKMFNSRKQPKSDLADLVEMMHVIMQLMENLQARGLLRVSRKSRKGKKKAASETVTKSKQFEDHAAAPDVDGSSVSERPAEYVEEQESPMKVASGLKEDTNTSPLVDGLGTSETKMGSPGDVPQVDDNAPGHADDNLCCCTDDSSDDEQAAAVNEVDFKVSSLISAFANCSFIQNLCWLLKFYRSNSSNTNQYIIGLLRKVTDDLELAPMLYQLSLLVTFYDILEEQKLSPSEDHADIVVFITSLVRKMLKKMKHQPLLFIEILFWKTRRECHYINAEYLLHELGHLKKGNRNQDSVPGNTEVESSEAANEWVRRSIADALGDDEADVVIAHDIGHQNGENCLENESEKIYERNRRFVFNDDMEAKLKDLYEEFKDHPNCSRLIADSLDPSGGVLPAQVSNKLKQLGLKVAPKKRIRNDGRNFTSSSDQQGGGSTLNDSNNLEGSSQRQPLNTRKRVSAFSKDQEAMIKDLFEQFKDHKRCSYMIANALDADNKFTAAQVSRKLKQLGLYVPRQKKSEENMRLRDEELNDLSANEMHDSDNETLLSFKNRKKDNGGLFNQEFPGQNMEREASDDADDETLSSVFKKTRKLPSKSKNEKLAAVATGERYKISGAVVANYVTERDENNQFTEMDVTFHHDSKEGTSEAVNPSPENIEMESADQQVEEQVEDELADSGDDAVIVEASIDRRRRRMVIDAEDDD
ncbi:hypothetical protein ES319_D12G280100v1 [Gossypium barbadense]|uniref:Timeless N-terminal domain-containing protein n=1 Tax=Gossypium barbadense TaxID=3634 RepID=A0A5J5P3H5_GOSBA|nr:hypothetical protein ES319_D12G280100v1 [Gossypium barbadense]